MAMREKFTKPSSSIYFYLVEWDPAKLSWEDFRGKVLGATDPATAADGSLRKTIFAQWKSLELAAEPNVGDNGVHARSADGKFFTILEGNLGTETSGLAFSPDRKHMYVALQGAGRVYAIRRSDGYAFDARTLDIKYHKA